MKKSETYSRVQSDMQWIRRCKQEELNLVDSYAGPKAQRIAETNSTSNKSSFFYPKPERMTLNQSKLTNETLSKMEEFKKSVQDDDFENVSKVSVKTPKTEISMQDKVSSVSKTSKVTTQSTKMRMMDLEVQLEQEKLRRMKAEKEVSELRASFMK